MSPQSSHPLLARVRRMDYTLRRPALDRLSLDRIESVLEELTRFHHEAAESLPDQETLYLSAVGCRLGSDLNEALISRLTDKRSQQDAAIEQLAEQLRTLLAERTQTIRLLHRARRLRERTAETGEKLGLGLIL